MPMALTVAQRSLMMRERHISDSGNPFVILTTSSEDRIARNLQFKGFGTYQNNGWQYTWRSRGGYTNTFWVNEEKWREYNGARSSKEGG